MAIYGSFACLCYQLNNLNELNAGDIIYLNIYKLIIEVQYDPAAVNIHSDCC